MCSNSMSSQSVVYLSVIFQSAKFQSVIFPVLQFPVLQIQLFQTVTHLSVSRDGRESNWRPSSRESNALITGMEPSMAANAVVTCAIIACNALQFLHAIIAGFQTCWKIFMRQKCCSQ